MMRLTTMDDVTRLAGRTVERWAGDDEENRAAMAQAIREHLPEWGCDAETDLDWSAIETRCYEILKEKENAS